MKKIIAEIQLSPSCLLKNKTSTEGITAWQKIKMWATDHHFASPPKHNASKNVILFNISLEYWLKNNTEMEVLPPKSPVSLIITLRFALEVFQRQTSSESYITLRCGEITAWDTMPATHITICRHSHSFGYIHCVACEGVQGHFLYVFPVSLVRFKTKANLRLQTPFTIWIPWGNFRQ